MTNDVFINQHDGLDLEVDMTAYDGTTYEMEDGEKLWLRVKTSASGEALISKEITTTHFDISTVDLSIGVYLLEVGIILKDGKEKTLIRSKLIVDDRLKEVSE